MPDKHLSKCCGAEVKVIGRTTLHYECLKCEEPCDVVSYVSLSQKKRLKIQLQKDYTKEAEKLLPEKKTYQNTNKWLDGGGHEAEGYNYAIDDCTPIVADLLKQIDELKEKR